MVLCMLVSRHVDDELYAIWRLNYFQLINAGIFGAEHTNFMFVCFISCKVDAFPFLIFF